MIKQDLINEVADNTRMSIFEVQEVINATIKAMTDHLNDGEDIILRGFGTFKIKTRAPKTVRNLNNGESWKTPARRVVVFEPGSELKK